MSSGLTVDMACAWRMFELAMGESAKEPSTKDRKIGIKTKRKLEKAACDGYQRTTNRFLKALNAPFQIKLEPEFDPDPQHGTRCHYSIVLEGKKIPVLFRTVTDERNLIDVPDFSSTLSGGDRNTLAFADWIEAKPLRNTCFGNLNDAAHCSFWRLRRHKIKVAVCFRRAEIGH